jgi:Glycosyl transferases group 1
MIDRTGVVVASAWAGRRVLVLSPTPTHPLDCGNRRRIYFVCRRIKQLGAEVHFLHYPSEDQWALSLPAGAQQRMIAEWDAYYVAPVTRPLYAPAVGEDHALDDWWDPAIADMLKWLFRVQTFDVFVVNYIWLSKAFASVPAGVIKIIDTHDRFSERRALFESHGLVQDFFHLGEDDEREGLHRADVVWAIKAEEEAFFRGIVDRPVLTLVHAEPVAATWPKVRGEILRFGITGSANAINIANFHNFLTAAAEYIRRTLLPCEIVLAGACCDRLEHLSYPFLHRMGRLERMDDFYDAVDVVLGPMEFSTGLKIRIGEALARGKAIVAHRHCFEGFTPTHPYHALPSFEAMMQACRDIVRVPRLIDDLEVASVEAMARAQRSADRALEATLRTQSETVPGFVLVLDLSDVWDGSLVLDHILEAAQYIGHHCPVQFFLDGNDGGFETRSLQRLRRFGPVMLSRTAATALGSQPGAPALLHGEVTSFAALLASGRLGFWLGSVPRHIPAVRRPVAAPVFVPLSVLALRLAEPRLRATLAALERLFAQVVAMDGVRSRLLDVAARGGATAHVVPALWCTDLSEALKAMAQAQPAAVTFLTPLPDGPLVNFAFEVARSSTSRPLEFVHDDRLLPSRKAPAGGSRPAMPESISLSDYVRRLGRGGTIPCLVVELGECSAFGALCELTDRAGVPRLSLFTPSAPRPVVAGRMPGRVGGVMESLLVLGECLGDETRFSHLAERSRGRYRALDPGWTIIWDVLSRIVSRRGRGAEVVPAVESGAGCREIGAEIVLHTGRQGDCRYTTQGWAGDRGRGQSIEAFGIRPLEALGAADIEYKALGPNGRETPWVSNAVLCGTRGEGVALTGFAIRLAAHLRDRFEVVYEGAFSTGGIVGPSRDGEPCVAGVADDPLEAIRVRLLERATA